MAQRKTTNKKSKAKADSRKGNASFQGRMKTFLKSDDFARIRGVFYMLLAIFILVAIVSFFVTGQEDDANWLGVLGNGMASMLASYTFGIASLGYSVILVSLCFYVFRHARRNQRYDEGLALEKRKPVLPLSNTVVFTLFWMAWLSIVLGYVAVKGFEDNEKFANLAGLFGVSIAAMLNGAIRIFTPILMVASAVVMLLFVHHVKVPKIELPQRQEQEEDQDENGVEELSARKESFIKRLFSKRANQDEAEGEEFVPDNKVDLKEEPARADALPLDIVTPETPEPVKEEVEEPITFDVEDHYGKPASESAATSSEPIFTVNIQEETPEEEKKVVAVEEEHEPPVLKDGQLVDPATGEPLPPYDPHLDLKDYRMPTLDILEDWEQKNVKVTKEELIANKDRIVTTLRNYGIEIVEISASPGPTVTLYEIKPAPGIRISKIKSLEDDIALSLAALGIRIIAPIPGKSAVGIEVPNAKPQIVSMKTMLSSEAFTVKGAKMELPIALGKTISNEPYVTDLAKMPHLLMAGATGTGKSVGLNAIIASLLYKKHPSELKFVMVDPKKVELSLYSKIERHYLAKMPDAEDAIITDVKKVVRTLNSLCIEMDQRYDLLKMAQVRKITEYNDKFKRRMLNPENGHRFLPYIVLVIDEFADLIMTAGKEVEMPICRLAQLARAVGIHLIIATQRPTTNIITGTIKTNFPARIAFRVTSAIDSRTILDTGGANQLIGRGDMLISLAGSDMVRIQCALIETEEIDRLGDSIGSQRGYPDGFLLPEYLDENEEPNKDFDPRAKDEKFDECARLVVASQFGSTSLLQRKLQLGYNRAGRIMDQLEAAGIVGPTNGSKPREVLIKDEVTLEETLRSL